jgi:hypothetical protein
MGVEFCFGSPEPVRLLPNKRAKARCIVVEECRNHDVAFDEIMYGRDRSKRIRMLRWLCWWRIRNEVQMSYPEIGRLFEGYDHSSVIHGVRRIAEILKQGVHPVPPVPPPKKATSGPERGKPAPQKIKLACG